MLFAGKVGEPEKSSATILGLSEGWTYPPFDGPDLMRLMRSNDIMADQDSRVSQLDRVWAINGLASEGPSPEFRAKLELFGQFVGDWVIEKSRIPQSHGVALRSKGEIHFGWILDGRDVQDVWMTRDPDTGRAVPVGTTVRFYDPKRDAWQSIWLSPVQGLVQTFTGRKIGDEIVLEGKTRDGYPEKWIFSEIKRTPSGGMPKRAATTGRPGCSRKKCEFEGEVPWRQGRMSRVEGIP